MIRQGGAVKVVQVGVVDGVVGSMKREWMRQSERRIEANLSGTGEMDEMVSIG